MPTSGEGALVARGQLTVPAHMKDLPELKPEDMQFFGSLLGECPEAEELAPRRPATGRSPGSSSVKNAAQQRKQV